MIFWGIKVKLERDDSGPLGLNEKLGLPVREKGVEWRVAFQIRSR